MFNSKTTRKILLTLIATMMTSSLQSEEVEVAKSDEPTVVFVGVAKAELHSGPSKEYYPTAILDRGTMLEVYRRTDDGWLGVRPPQGSFSWVQAKDAYLLPGGKVVEITEEDAVSWIGTELGTAKQYRWQVDLKPGEQLVVLSEASMEDSEGNASLWYKIAPPSGEFRWIQEAAVTTKAPKITPAGTASATETDASTAAAGAKSILDGSSNAAEKSRRSNTVQPASVSKGQPKNGAAVQTAQYTEDVFSDGQIVTEGQGYPQGEMYANGEIVYEGQVMHNGRVVHDGDVIYEGEYVEGNAIPPAGHPSSGPVYRESISAAPSAAPGDFGGYHAFQFGDDGLRFLLAERYLHKRGPMIDPLEYDPFSLKMPVRNDMPANTRVPPGVIPRRTNTSQVHQGPVVTSSGYEPPQGVRRDRPWRDPRALRQNRLSGYVATPTDRSPRELVNDIRNQVNRLGETVRGMTRRDQHQSPSFDFAGSSQNPAEDSDARVNDNQRFADNASGSDGDSLAFYSPPMISTDTDNLSTDGSSSSGLSSGKSPGTSNGQNPEQIDWYGVNRGSEAAASSNNSLSGGSSAPSIRGELEQLEVRLTDMVAKPPSLWNLDPIMARTRELIDRGANPIERGQARLLLERAEKFQQHARRSAFVPGANFQARYQQPIAPNATGSASFQTASAQGGTSISMAGFQQPAAATSLQKKYDATGWLVPVHSSTPGQPTHALTNATGAVLAYVTGLPGMNLNLYVNQPVGVVGRRGYLPQLQAGHIQAERIVPLK